MRLINEDDNYIDFDVSGNISPDNELDISRKTASAGGYRQSVAGERFIIEELCVVSGAELRATLNFINRNFEQMYYIPDNVPVEMTTTDFPLAVNVRYSGKSERWYNGQVEYVIRLQIESTDYL